jgi:predicted SAM-dependent methyltransferase
MLNHSIEHLPDPVSACTHIRKLLNPGGHVLVRTPIASSYAFRKYGSAWAAIDAPRHKVIHTLSSMYILASGVGFQVVHVEYDSTPFQFIASEQFSRNIATTEPKSHYVSSRDSIFSKSQIRAFSKLARYLNKIGDGDSACFLLR